MTDQRPGTGPGPRSDAECSLRTYVPPKAGWTDKARTDAMRLAALDSLRLVVEQLESCAGTTVCDEWADALAAADAHLEQARYDVNKAFDGIDS